MLQEANSNHVTGRISQLVSVILVHELALVEAVSTQKSAIGDRQISPAENISSSIVDHIA
jgi:hypothetical protein